jgi:hypothetical protein
MFVRSDGEKYEYALSTLLADGPKTSKPEGQPDGNWHPAPAEAGAQMTEIRSVLHDLVEDDSPFTEEDLKSAMATPGFMDEVEQAMRQAESTLG